MTSDKFPKYHNLPVLIVAEDALWMLMDELLWGRTNVNWNL